MNRLKQIAFIAGVCLGTIAIFNRFAPARAKSIVYGSNPTA